MPFQARSGFTLLEVLIVLVLTGILAMAVTLSLSQVGSRRLGEEAERLRSRLQFAADEAIMQHTEMGAYILPTRYGFLSYDPGAQRWNQAQGALYQDHPLPEEMQLTLQLDGAPISLPRAGVESSLRPALVFLSSGEGSAFQLRLSTPEGDHLDIASDGLARIAIREEAAP